MAEQFLHGVEVVEIADGPRVVRSTKSSVIGVVGTAPLADPKVFPLDTPVLIAGSRAKAAKLGITGTLRKATDAIFEQIGAMIIVIRVAEGKTDAETIQNIIGSVDSQTGQHKGLKAFYVAESITHVAPKILIAPTFTHQRPNGTANPVVSSLLSAAEFLKAVIIADGPNTSTVEAINYRKDFSSDRVYVVDPWVIDVSGSAAPPSAYVAGVIAKTDHNHGFWWSPSNQSINGITGTSKPISFSLGNPACNANVLNQHEVATIIRQNGFRLWGNRTCSSDPKFAFLSVRRTADIINDSLLRAHLWAVDRHITRTYLDDVSESVNAYLSHLKSIGAILGGYCYPDGDLNTPANIADGKVYFTFDFTPPYPAEHIVFRSHLTNEYIKELI